MCKYCRGTGIILWDVPAAEVDPIYKGSKAKITMSKDCPYCKEVEKPQEEKWWEEA